MNRKTGKVVWLYGRPCSGKSTLSASIAEALRTDGISVITLDGDELRSGMNSDLGYSLVDRYENIRRASEMARMMAGKGFWVVCSFVTPTRELRELVRIINNELELCIIFIHASLEVCKKRDVKGHYLKAETRQLTNFTGISSPFEDPLSFDNTIYTNELNVQDATRECLKLILDSKYKPSTKSIFTQFNIL